MLLEDILTTSPKLRIDDGLVELAITSPSSAKGQLLEVYINFWGSNLLLEVAPFVLVLGYTKADSNLESIRYIKQRTNRSKVHIMIYLIF